MTDQDLAQRVAERIREEEARADPERAKRLRKAHGLLDRAFVLLMPEMGLQPLSGGTPKPPEAP